MKFIYGFVLMTMFHKIPNNNLDLCRDRSRPVRHWGLSLIGNGDLSAIVSMFHL